MVARMEDASIWKTIALYALGAWATLLSLVVKTLHSEIKSKPGPDVLKATLDALTVHREQDTIRFDQLIDRMERIADDASKSRHALRTDLQIVVTNQNVINLQMTQQLGRLEGGMSAVIEAANKLNRQ